MLDIQYVKNLDLDVTEELLTEKFSKFGKILSLIVSKDEYGASRGFGFVFGFVCFSTPEEANKAVNNFHVGFHDWTLSKFQYLRLRALQQQSYTHYFYEANVGAGLPIISTLQGLLETGDKILRIEGIFKEPKQELYQVDENDEELPNFYKFYEKSHKSHKTNDWIDSRCGDLHNMNIHVTN
ncbi:unnamed protein product [Camellia sinensis]